MSGEGPVVAPGLERTAVGPLVLLFYDGYERRALPGPIGGLKSQALRAARYAYRSVRKVQVHTGFYTAFLSLYNSLKLAGCDVRVNDFEAARSRPNYPIGLAGYPSVLKAVDLPNPAIIGPGDYGYPDKSVAVAQDSRYKLLIQPGEWYCEYYRPYNGDKLRPWPVGIDLQAWPDLSSRPKTLDVLIYDKIRWYQKERRADLLEPIISRLRADGRSVEVLTYGDHILTQYRDALSRAKAMVFLCEHETQGIAYQEAMASGVPILAWDDEVLVDPIQLKFASQDLVVSSVPYFDERCGMKFKRGEFDQVYPEFWKRLDSFRPREYVAEELSMRHAAQAYLDLYCSVPNQP